MGVCQSVIHLFRLKKICNARDYSRNAACFRRLTYPPESINNTVIVSNRIPRPPFRVLGNGNGVGVMVGVVVGVWVGVFVDVGAIVGVSVGVIVGVYVGVCVGAGGTVGVLEGVLVGVCVGV